MINGEIIKFEGPKAPGITVKDAQQYCERNGLGYCIVDMVSTCEHEIIDFELN